MLSILIPVYNYAVLPLISELQKQCISCGIKFEILCYDDASNLFIKENQEVNQLKYCAFISLEKNIGRSAIRNLLAEKANFQNLLFLDADVIPAHNQFIENYISEINKNEKVVFGGLLYENQKPSKELLLRWIYGKEREALSLSERSKNHSDFALVSNLLIKKEILIHFPFDETLTKYGYEDLLFFSVLKSNQIKIKHIENPVFHLNLESSSVFLSKTKISLENLAFLNRTNKISVNESRIIASFELLKKVKALTVFNFIFRKIESKIERNLISETPSLFWFDIYKLGYFSSLKSK